MTNFTQSTDTFTGIQFQNPNDTWTIDPNVFVFGPVFSDQSASTLQNNGYIFATSDNAVRFEGMSGAINNMGHISAIGTTILLTNNCSITNNATILSYEGNAIDTTAAVLNLANAGEIHAKGAAIFIHTSGAFSQSSLTNSGLLFSSDDSPLKIESDLAPYYVITNSGTIRSGQPGAHPAIVVTDASLDFTNTSSGKVIGDFVVHGQEVGLSSTTILNKGTITGDVKLGAGDDQYEAKGNGTSGKVFGGDGFDGLFGGKGNEKFYGGADFDAIEGGGGRDLLWGGKEQDFFYYSFFEDSKPGAGRDKIMDFSHAQHDKIHLQEIDPKRGFGWQGDQKFNFIGKQDFHNKKGELRYEDEGNKVIVQGDINGDGKADFEIFVNVGSLMKGDFYL